MNAITYKYPLFLSKKSLLLASLLAVFGALAFTSPASAASQTYAISCGKNNSVKINGDKVSCEKKGKAKVTIQGIGTKEDAAGVGQSYPDSVPLTLVVVNCGKNSNADLTLGAPVTAMTCAKGTPKEVRLQKVSPNPIPAAKEKDQKVGTYKLDSNGNTTGGDDLTALAKTDPCGGVNCKDPAADPTANCDGNEDCDFISKYLNPLIKLFSYIFGVIAVISLIVGGITYSASGGDPQKVTAAKKRIINTVIAVVAYFFLFAFLQFLIPGGLFR